jgi:hypothetical protein
MLPPPPICVYYYNICVTSVNQGQCPPLLTMWGHVATGIYTPLNHIQCCQEAPNPQKFWPQNPKRRFCCVVFNSQMFNATKVQLWKWCFHIFHTFCEANTCVALRRSVRALFKCYQNIGSDPENTVVKTVELTWVVYYVAEPRRQPTILVRRFFVRYSK